MVGKHSLRSFKIRNKHALAVSDVETCNFYSEKF